MVFLKPFCRSNRWPSRRFSPVWWRFGTSYQSTYPLPKRPRWRAD